MEKEIRGIIVGWTMNDNRITGKIGYVAASVRGRGDHITTSNVIRIFRTDLGETLIAETNNSLYILM